MITITTSSIAVQVLTAKVNQHLLNHTTDIGLIRELGDAILRERGVDIDESVEDVVSGYVEWSDAIKKLKQADDAYHNAETGSDDEAAALCKKNAAEAEAQSCALTLKRTMNDL